MDFDAADLQQQLEQAGPESWDAAEFGIVAMDKNGDVTGYNTFEARMAGLSRESVVGRHFFTEIAPCTNNYLVASRYEEEDQLDEIVDYVFTVRMKARPVKLRLLKTPESETMFMAVQG